MTYTEEEKKRIRELTVGVAGCGGLGGYIIEYLLRLGASHIKAADGDSFEASNLNRQLYSSPSALGKSKVLEAKKRAGLLRPDCRFEAVEAFIDGSSAAEFVKGCDIVIDALDNGKARRILADACAAEGICFVHGAISGFVLQLAVIAPEGELPDSVLGSQVGETESFIPAACAALEVSEAMKAILRPEYALTGRLLQLDLLTNEQLIIEL